MSIKVNNSNSIAIPEHGFIAEIAKITGYSRTTISKALRHNTKGIKAEKVRQIYQKLYGNG